MILTNKGEYKGQNIHREDDIEKDSKSKEVEMQPMDAIQVD